MATFDSEIAVNIALDAPPIDAAGFGTVLLAALATSLQVGFTERVRFYESVEEVENDADLSASLQAAGALAFSQGPPAPARFAIGRLDALVAEVTEIAITGVNADGDGLDWTVAVGDLEASYTQQVADDAAAVGDGLQAAIHALANASATDDDAGTITVTGANAGEDLNITVTPAGSGTATVNTTTPAVTVKDGLDNILAEESNFYGLCIESRDAWDIISAAAFAEANKRLFVAQSSDSAVKSTTYSVSELDVASKLRQSSYTHTLLLFYSTDATWADVGWATNRLAVDPDTNTTIWKFATLAGVAVDAGNVTATQKANILSKYANTYLTFFKQGATGDGTVANGQKADLILTADWLKARSEEAFAQLLINATNRGEKIPYTDAGFQVLAQAVLGILATGVDAGHFVAGTAFVNMPELVNVSASARAARALTFTFGAQPAGAIESVAVTGYVSIDI